ncbi:hypothetical protein Hypma_009745 [Hypsizygus marmoreus]|uniref:Uncharacterized protein n=1 Tax=Hypsizygus marmoreus TaxID=39966 RepID=A0A369JME2_HYPMA|nr:hypothetical protein Hypma_009745 [Hypsizygus marmoreus]
MDPLIQEDVSTGLVQLIADTRLTNSFALAALTALLYVLLLPIFVIQFSWALEQSRYDHSASFPDEFALIWQGRWSNVLKILTAISLLSPLVVEYSTGLAFFFIFHVKSINQWFIGGRDHINIHRHNSGLCPCAAPIELSEVEVMIMLLVNHRILPHYENTLGTSYLGNDGPFDGDLSYVKNSPILPGCHPLTFSRGFTIFAIPPLIVSFFMFLMTMYKCNTTLRMGVRARMPLIALFLRDGVFWFLGIFTFVLAAIINWNVARPSLLDLLNDIFSIMASRALLNIPRVLLQDTEDDLEGSYNSDNFHPTSIIFKPLGELSSVAFQRNEELG